MNSTAEESKDSKDEMEDVNDGTSTKLYVLASIIILTLVGNLLIMFLVIRRRENPMTRVHFFMLHLSIGNFV